jgi:hypothetical protein
MIVADRGRICGGITARTSAIWRRYATIVGDDQAAWRGTTARIL